MKAAIYNELSTFFHVGILGLSKLNINHMNNENFNLINFFMNCRYFCHVDNFFMSVFWVSMF